MAQATHLFRRALLALLGLLPFIGAFLSVTCVPWTHGVFATGAAGLVAWLFGYVFSPIGAIVLIQSLYVGMQSLLWQRYRPFPLPGSGLAPASGGPMSPMPDERWPCVSVVIPAFNEGAMVEHSIRSAARSDYPRGRLEILVVDDGSRDDTFFHMLRLRREFPDLVRLLRFDGNRGKRAALEAGFRAATGDILLTVDSDSEVERSTVREMMAPFLADPNIGAVAGRVAVLNRDSLVSRMLEVQYSLAFDFGRAAQSTYRTVACCPGALSAFRRELVIPFLGQWTDQTFLGRPVNHGEDQALTNIVLRQGKDTVYQRTAVVHTLAPTTYRGMTRMFLRWDRSYIVEGLSFARFMFTRYRAKNRALPIVAFVVSNLRLVIFCGGLAALPHVFRQDARGALEGALALSVGAFFSAAYYLRIERSFRFVYGALYAGYSALLLQWVLPWALLTVRDERWGTR
jgi:hyaluronan synthase